jgi:hypothetical protein
MSSDEAFVVRVLAALRVSRLEAIIVGNVAAVLQGAPVTTQDLDLLVRGTVANRRKIAAFAAELGGAVRQISPLSDTLRIDIPAGVVDLLFDALPGRLSFQSVRSRALRSKIVDERALIARLDDVIASKEAANRPKDRAQLPILRDTLKVTAALAATPRPRRRR